MDRCLILASVASMIDQFNMPLIRYFQNKGLDVHVAANFVEGNTSSQDRIIQFKNELNRFNVVCHQIDFPRNPFYISSCLKSYVQLCGIFKTNKYKFVHCHSPIGGFLGRRVACKFGVFVIYTAHGFHFYRGGSFFPNIFYRALEKQAAGWTDHLFVINEEDYVAACSFLSADKVTYLQGGVGLDLSEYDPRSVTEGEVAALRGEMGLKEGEPLFLMVGEFNANKRQADLIRAFAAMRPGKERSHLAFAGTGPAEEPMKQLARRLGVAERVHFLGFRGDVKALLKAAAALVLPSRREGLPRCLMEAIVMGTPIIGSDTRGTRDLVRLAGGRLFPVGDVAALAEAMEVIVAGFTPSSMNEVLRSLFDVEEMVKKVYSIIYNKLEKQSD